MRRRTPLAVGSVAALVVLLSTVLPGAAATGTRPRSVRAATNGSPIQHVVVIDLENHSFDNVLGFWCDANPGRCPDGGMPVSVTLSNGAVVIPGVMPDTVPYVQHNVQAQLAAMDIKRGVPRMDGWQNYPDGSCNAATHYQCVGGYQPVQIPNLTTLAQDFAISDHTFELSDAESWAAHLYAVTGSVDGFYGNNPQTPPGVTSGPGWGCDSNKVTQWRAQTGALVWVPSCVPDYGLGLPNGGAFRPTPVSYQPTILDELAAAGLTWRIYGTASASAGTDPTSGGYVWSICPSLAECLYTSQRDNLVDNSQFFADAAAGALPTLSLITAGGTYDGGIEASCHNGFSMAACDDYIGQLVGAVESSPDWPTTAVFITFDDFGGFYDQVPPGLSPDDSQEGPRVPVIIVSPYVIPGYTDTTATSFAGILAYIEQNFGLPPLGPNDASAYGFTNAFDYAQPPLKPVKMVNRPLPTSARRIRVTQADLDDPS